MVVLLLPTARLRAAHLLLSRGIGCGSSGSRIQGPDAGADESVEGAMIERVATALQRTSGTPSRKFGV